MIHSPYNTTHISFICFNPCPFSLAFLCRPLLSIWVWIITLTPMTLFLLSDKTVIESSGTGIDPAPDGYRRDIKIRKKQTNPKGNSSYVPHKGIALEWRKRNGFCGYKSKWRNSTVCLVLFLSSSMLLASDCSHPWKSGISTSFSGKVRCTQHLSILQFPNQQSRNNDFSLSWVRGGWGQKNPGIF